MKTQHYIGLMSGTSMDGIDAALVSFENNHTQFIDGVSLDIPNASRNALKKLLQNEIVSLALLGETDVQIGKLFAQSVLDLLKKTGFDAKDIIAIGSHGQTIYHSPNTEHGFTMQIGDPNIIAARTGITTVADFRRRDIAHGGQGAPLVPRFHDYLLRDRTADQFVINIGGIANITHLPLQKNIIGFDIGPGNALLDAWCEKNTGKLFDAHGAWAKSGELNSDLLTILLDDPYFKKPYPKSTGKEYFNLNWLNAKLALFQKNISPEDIQNTLTELTAKTIADTIPSASTIYLCGGGICNLLLIERLQTHLPKTQILSTEKIGAPAKWMEAMAFAWLAKQTIEKKSGNCISVTGAEKEVILGGIYYA